MFFYRLRWTLVDYLSVGSDHPLGSAAYMSEASLKKGPAWGLSTTLDAGRLGAGRFGAGRLNAGRYGCGSSITLIIYAIVKTPGG